MKRRGFSLVETLITASLMAVIAGAVMGVMSVAVRASGVDDPRDLDTEVRSRIAEELALATKIISIDTHAIKFEVADRSGDAVPETIEYALSGQSQDELVRVYNETEQAVLLREVQSLSFIVLAGRRNESDGETLTSSEEVVLARHRPTEFEAVTLNVGGEIECAVRPAFHSAVRSWRPTSLRLKLASQGDRTGNFDLTVYRVNTNGRASQPLSRIRLSESNLQEEFSDVEIPLAVATTLEPNDGLLIVLGGADSQSTVRVSVQLDGVADRHGRLAVRADDQLQAREYPAGSLSFELSGAVIEQSEAQAAILRGHSLELNLATKRSRMSGLVPLWGSPRVPLSDFVREDSIEIEDSALATGGG